MVWVIWDGRIFYQGCAQKFIPSHGNRQNDIQRAEGKNEKRRIKNKEKEKKNKNSVNLQKE